MTFNKHVSAKVGVGLCESWLEGLRRRTGDDVRAVVVPHVRDRRGQKTRLHMHAILVAGEKMMRAWRLSERDKFLQLSPARWIAATWKNGHARLWRVKLKKDFQGRTLYLANACVDDSLAEPHFV